MQCSIKLKNGKRCSSFSSQMKGKCEFDHTKGNVCGVKHISKGIIFKQGDYWQLKDKNNNWFIVCRVHFNMYYEDDFVTIF